MTTPYSQSLRSVYDNGFWPWAIGVAVTLALILVWGAWFLMARVSLVVTSPNVEVVSGYRVLVSFPAADIARIYPGQPATLQLNSQSADQATSTLPATVLEVFSLAADQPGTATLELLPTQADFAIEQVVGAVSRQATIVVESVSPWELTLRALGKAAGSP